MVGQGGRPSPSPLGLPGGDRPSRQGDRDGGQSGGREGGGRLGRAAQLHVAYGNALIAARGYGRAGDDGSLRQGARLGGWRQGRARNGWRPTMACGSAASLRGELPAMRAHAAAFLSDVDGEARFARGRRRASRRRNHALVRRRVPRSARASRTRARAVPTRARRRSGLSLRT